MRTPEVAAAAPTVEEDGSDSVLTVRTDRTLRMTRVKAEKEVRAVVADGSLSSSAAEVSGEPGKGGGKSRAGRTDHRGVALQSALSGRRRSVGKRCDAALRHSDQRRAETSRSRVGELLSLGRYRRDRRAQCRVSGAVAREQVPRPSSRFEMMVACGKSSLLGFPLDRCLSLFTFSR